MHGKLQVRAAQARNEMILPGSDGPFRSIAAAHVGWDQLVLNLVGLVIGFHGIGGFIVDPMYSWMEPTIL